MALKNTKKHQTMESSNSGLVGVDKISNLPDEIIHHILSLLPTKCVMSTCILSKRWKYLSNSFPILDFRNCRAINSMGTVREERLKTQQLMDFLDTVLCLHEKPYIQKFHLTWDKYFDEPRVNKWISIVIKRKVEERFLSVGPETSFIFPLCFFTCDSLTVLKLDRVILNVPNTVSFPRVKILRLTYMDFGNGISANKLLSNCPILEELSLIVCGGFKSVVLCIANLALKNFCIRYCDLRESTLKICAPNLCTICYGGELPVDFVFGSFPSLVEADFNIYCSSANTFLLVKLFEKLSNVKLLRISASAVQVLGEADILLSGSLTFNNLNHLELRSGSVSTVRRYFRFIQLSPNLKSIVFPGSIYISGREDADYLPLDPKCSPPHLKSIKFLNFDGLPSELNAVRFFMKYARFLESVTVVASSKLSKDHEKQINAMQMLLMFPKPANCVVKFLMSSGNA